VHAFYRTTYHFSLIMPLNLVVQWRLVGISYFTQILSPGHAVLELYVIH
jgi:hypothetical protein